MDRNMVKSNSPNAPSNSLIFSVPVPTLPRKLANVLLLAFSVFQLVAALSQCLCSESKKKKEEIGEYPQ
jgi:hypothetical protein